MTLNGRVPVPMGAAERLQECFHGRSMDAASFRNTGQEEENGGHHTLAVTTMLLRT